MAVHYLSVDDIVSFYRCVAAIGALDYVSHDVAGVFEGINDSNPELLDPAPGFKQISLHEPLKRWYLQQARTQWRALRELDLSDATLRAPSAIHANEWMRPLFRP